MDIFARKNELVAPKPADAGAKPAINGGDLGTVAEAAPLLGVINALPWASAGCPSCEGKGLNTKGSPCRICDSRQRKAGGPTSGDFVLDVDGEGNMVWEALDGSGGGSVTLSVPEPKVETRVEVEPPPAESSTTPEKMPPDSALTEASGEEVTDMLFPDKDEEEEVAVTAPAPAKTRGRPKTGYTLYIDCVPMGVKTTPAEVLFDKLALEMAAQVGKPYFDMDPFKRRENWALASPSYVEMFNKMHIVVRNPQGSPDMRAFIDSIRGVASPGSIIEGLS